MTATIPNLWEGKFSQHTVSPLAVLRTHAANFNSQSGGLLRAEVEHRTDLRDSDLFRVISFEIVAPGLDYRQGVLTAEHLEQGAYPVQVFSSYLGETREIRDRAADPRSRTCLSQERLVEVLREITESNQLMTLIESLIAQINDANLDN